LEQQAEESKVEMPGAVVELVGEGAQSHRGHHLRRGAEV